MKGVVSGIIITLLLLGFISFLGKTSLEDVSCLSNQTPASIVSDYENVTTHEGDLIINGTQTYVIKNCTYIQTGNIYVDDYAKLIIRNSVLSVNQTYLNQFGLRVQSWATLEIANSTVNASRGIGISGTDNSKINIDNSYAHEAGVWGDGTSSFTINGSTLGEVSLSGNSKMLISNSRVVWVATLDFCGTDYNNQDTRLYGLKQGFFSYWDLHQNQTNPYTGFGLTLANSSVAGWSLIFNYDTKAIISNSTIERMWVSYFESIASVQGLRPGFHSNWALNSIILQKTDIGHWLLDIIDSSVEITDTEALFIVRQKSNVSISNSNNLILHSASWFSGAINVNQSTFTAMEMFQDSDFNIWGNISEVSGPEIWFSSNVTRNYNVIARKTTDNTMENVTLTLVDKNSTPVWNGTADNLGYADFNLTFTDNNHTDTLKVEAFKEGFYNITKRIGFLSNTPIILNMTQKPLGDINEDRVVNILDVSLVAYSFGCIPDDPRWKMECDLNNDEIINILDISMIAKDYGKTV